MTDIKFPIIDLFVSIQGEGQYAGVPSIFIRTSGCNLRCVFGNSICDTPYSSFKPEQSKYTIDDVIKLMKENPQVRSIVITGGEPTLYQNALAEMLHYIEDNLEDDELCFYTITVETNGACTIDNDDLINYIDLWSISPKLHTSIAKPNQVINTPEGEYTFSEEEIERYDKARKNIANIASLILSGNGTQLKFVYSGMDSYNEILEWVDEIQQVVDGVLEGEDMGYSVDVNKYIMLMPEGMTEEVLQMHRKEAAEICVKKGWMYTDRLHITIWGDKRGF